jgi:uncharacterized Zn-binding protein involved in type VI secretion
MGDPTAHGGLVAAGEPTVLMNGAPAARLGDAHVCPLTSGPAPHVGGPVAAGSAAVRINGQPAARTGDLCTCCGPPDLIAGGEPTVQIADGGSGQTLIGGGEGWTRIGGQGMTRIGGGGSVGRGRAAGRGRAGSAAALQAEAASTALLEDEDPPDSVYALAVRFVDAGKRPLASQIRTLQQRGDIETRPLPGNGGVYRPADRIDEKADVWLQLLSRMRWSRSSVRQDETVKVTARAAGFNDGTPARIVIRRLDASGHSPAVDEIRAVVQGEEIDATWTGVDTAVRTAFSDAPLDAGPIQPPPVFVAEATVEGAVRPARTGPLSVTGDLSVRVLDSERRPLPDLRYRLFLSGGEVREGRTDRSGGIAHREGPAGAARLQLASPSAPVRSDPVSPSDTRFVRRATPGRAVFVSTGEETEVMLSGPWIQVGVWIRGSEARGTFILHATGARSPNDAAYWQEMHAADGTFEEGRLRLCFPAGEDTGIGAAPAFTLRRETADAVDVLFDGVPQEALVVMEASEASAFHPA